jgi:hypothetical protein
MTSILGATWTLIAGAIVLFLPGIAWLALFWDPDKDVFENLADALGVSISLTALLALLAYVIDLNISSIGLILFYLLLIPLFVWSLRRWRLSKRSPYQNFNQIDENEFASDEVGNTRSVDQLAWVDYLRDTCLALIFILILIWRFYQIRSIVLPVWVDSIHHVQIVGMLLDHGGLPDTFDPFMPVPFFYHYAFHSLGAVFSFFTRLSPENSVLILGQVLNAGIALAVYRLGKALWGDWRRAMLSSILVAFVTHMPAYYASWGRYTLLTGMVLLPLAMAAALDIVHKGVRPARIATFSILTAGILLAHYFAAALLAIFIIILCLQVVIQDLRHEKSAGWKIWFSLFLGSLAGILMAGPWLYRMWEFARRTIDIGAIPLTIEAVENFYFTDYLSYLWRLLGPQRNHAVLFVALVGLVIILIRKRTLAFGLWTITLCLITLPWGIYVTPFRPDHAAIVLFLPTALLVADLFISAIDWSPEGRLSRLKTLVVLLLLAALVGWGVWGTRSVINSATILATEADLEALHWIDDKLPQDARFFINVNHWQYGLFRGVDGGWWITPLTGRETLLPSGLYPLGDSVYVNRVNDLAARASQIKGCTPDFWEIVQEQGFTYIYLNGGRGSVRPNHFKNCPDVELIFTNDNVFVYRILVIK